MPSQCDALWRALPSRALSSQRSLLLSSRSQLPFWLVTVLTSFLVDKVRIGFDALLMRLLFKMHQDRNALRYRDLDAVNASYQRNHVWNLILVKNFSLNFFNGNFSEYILRSLVTKCRNFALACGERWCCSCLPPPASLPSVAPLPAHCRSRHGFCWAQGPNQRALFILTNQGQSRVLFPCCIHL